MSDSSSGPDRADARPRRCFAQRPRLGSGCPLGGSGSEALRPSTTAPLIGRGRLPQPHRLRKQHGYGARRNPRRVDSRTAGTMQQSATRDETTPSRSQQQSHWLLSVRRHGVVARASVEKLCLAPVWRYVCARHSASGSGARNPPAFGGGAACDDRAGEGPAHRGSENDEGRESGWAPGTLAGDGASSSGHRAGLYPAFGHMAGVDGLGGDRIVDRGRCLGAGGGCCTSSRVTVDDSGAASQCADRHAGNQRGCSGGRKREDPGRARDVRRESGRDDDAGPPHAGCSDTDPAPQRHGCLELLTATSEGWLPSWSGALSIHAQCKAANCVWGGGRFEQAGGEAARAGRSLRCDPGPSEDGLRGHSGQTVIAPGPTFRSPTASSIPSS